MHLYEVSYCFHGQTPHRQTKSFIDRHASHKIFMFVKPAESKNVIEI